jgi:hypothetical protein
MSNSGARKFTEQMQSINETIDFALDSFLYLGMPATAFCRLFSRLDGSVCATVFRSAHQSK